MRGRETGLFAEPPGEVTRIAEAEGFGNGRHAGAAFEPVLGGAQQLAVAPLPEGQTAGPPHETVEIVFLQTGAPRQFARTRPTTVGADAPSALQASEDARPGARHGVLAGASATAGVENEQCGAAGGQVEVAPVLGGQSGDLLPHGREGFGGELSAAETFALRGRAAEIGDEADGAARGLFAEFMDATGRDEEYRAGSGRMALPADALFAVPAQVEEELPVRMTVGGVTLEGLQVAVDPQGADGPVAAAQLETPQDEGGDRGGRGFRHQHNK